MNTVIWVSSARYTQPLDATARAKWKLLAEHLARDLIVVSFAADGRAHDFTEQGVRFVLLPSVRWSVVRYGLFYTLMPLTLIRLLRGRPGVTLIAQSPFEGVAGAWVRQLYRRRTRLVIENHNSFEQDLFLQRRIPLRGVVQRLMIAAARYAYRYADATRSVSLTTEARALVYAPNVPSVRFMAWSDTSAFASAVRTVPVEQAQAIIYAGVLRPGKGVHVLLAAFARLASPVARLRLIGEPQNASYAAELHAQAEQLQIADRVAFVGRVTQTELAQALAGARVLVLPSFSEGMPRVVIEAMLTGTPVIATRVGGIPEMVRDDENGWLIAPDNVDDLVVALERAFSSADYATMGENARAFALDFFSPERYVQGHRDLLAAAERPTSPD